MRNFSVLLRSAEDLPGHWIAHCLDWDLVTQGVSPSDAARSLGESLAIVLEEDRSDGLKAEDRPPAPAVYWDLFHKTLHTGVRVASGDVDRFKHGVIAAFMYLSESRTPIRIPLPDAEYPFPPPFMIAEFQRDSAPH